MACLRSNKSGTYKIKGYLKTIQYIIPLICSKDTIWAYIGWMAICVINSGLFVVNTMMMQKFLDAAAGADIQKAIINLLLFTGTLCFNLFFSGLSIWGDFMVEKKSTKALNVRLFRKIDKIDPWEMNKPEYWDELEKSKNGIEAAVYIVQVLFFMLSWHVPYFIFMCIYLYKINPLFTGLLLVVFLAILVTQRIKTKFFVHFEEEKASVQRRVSYFDKCIFGLELCKETRVLNAIPFFKKKYYNELVRYNEVSRTSERKAVAVDLCSKLIIWSVYLLIAVVLLYSLNRRIITVGIFIAVFNSVERMFTMVRSMVISNVGFIVRNMSGVNFFVQFMQKEEVERTGAVMNDETCIKLNNVSFRYPQMTNYILKSINLEIAPKETIVIVGENGAGKSTLIDIILGLYKPQEGTVSYGNYKDSSKRYYIENASAVFQDYVRYKMNIRDNISISNSESCVLTELKKNSLFKKNNDQMIHEIMDSINFSDVNQNLHMDQMLSTEFGGIDISGGVWQRVAACRSLFKDSVLIVLDEPTSAMDPTQESKIYEMYRQIAKDRTTIIVSHRLGICKIADRVVVLSKGEIIGLGSHEELLQGNQEYKRMWDAQAGFYESN